MFKYILFYTLLTKIVTRCFEPEWNYPESISEGEKLYHDLIQKAESSCWNNIVLNINKTCSRISEKTHSLLALNLTNCFLKSVGLEVSECNENITIAQCLEEYTDQRFLVYVNLYSSTFTICNYLQYKNWQESTSKTIYLLKKSAQFVTNKLAAYNASLNQVLSLQKYALEQQNRMIKSSRAIKMDLLMYQKVAKRTFKDFEVVSNEQKKLIFQIFDRIRSLQSFILGQFMTLFTVVYYIGSIIVLFILTSIEQTSKARIWVLLLQTANLIFENILVSYFIEEEYLRVLPLQPQGPLYNRIWLCRKFMAMVCILIISFVWYHYQDYSALNHSLLTRIEDQNSEILKFFKEIKEEKEEASSPTQEIVQITRNSDQQPSCSQDKEEKAQAPKKSYNRRKRRTS